MNYQAVVAAAAIQPDQEFVGDLVLYEDNIGDVGAGKDAPDLIGVDYMLHCQDGEKQLKAHEFFIMCAVCIAAAAFPIGRRDESGRQQEVRV